MALKIGEEADAVTFDVKVVPRSSRERLGLLGERLKVQLTAPPVDGAANEALVALLAARLGRPRTAIRIVQGTTGRNKTVRVVGLDRATLISRLEAAFEADQR